MVDAMVTALCALGDVRGMGRVDGRPIRNSATGSIYIVKPKMHGPDEVALACELFSRIEAALGLVQRTLKMGIMDEERRTSLGLKECISRARDRVVFINTGFLDRTGDEIHTDMEAGPVIPKTEMKAAAWLGAYENSNVDTGLACGLRGRAQIGKGMWTMPGEMAAMVKAKIQHPIAGASTAWVPSPTAATLHAMHYFLVDVADRQSDLADRTPARLASLIDIPVLPVGRELSSNEIQRELDNNVQGVLGYLVRWVGQGVGCSTVPDIADVGLMEDLATLRISSQHIANWMHHGFVSAETRYARRCVAWPIWSTSRTAATPTTSPWPPTTTPASRSRAAVELVFAARDEPSGYTERVLRSHTAGRSRPARAGRQPDSRTERGARFRPDTATNCTIRHHAHHSSRSRRHSHRRRGVGASIGYQLARHSDRRVVVVDARPPVGGISGRTFGQIRQHYSNELMVRMALRGFHCIRNWASEVGYGDPGYVRLGYMLIVTENQINGLRRNVELGRKLGVDTRFVGPEEIASIEPLVNAENLAGGAYEPDGGYIDVTKMVLSWLGAATACGADVLPHSPCRRSWSPMARSAAWLQTGARSELPSSWRQPARGHSTCSNPWAWMCPSSDGASTWQPSSRSLEPVPCNPASPMATPIW